MAEQHEEVKYLKSLVKANRADQQVFRGCIFGLFSAIGTTIGFAFVLILAVNILGGIREIPIISDIISQTKVDVLIEKQLARLGGVESQPEVYNDAVHGFSLSYPASMQILRLGNTANSTYTLILNGENAPSAIEIYLNPSLKIAQPNGAAVPMAFSTALKNEFKLYPAGTYVDDVPAQHPVFVYQTTLSGNNSLIVISEVSDDNIRVGKQFFSLMVDNIRKN